MSPADEVRPLDRQPLLAGELVELRPLARGDRDALYAVASDPEIWAQHPISDRWREDMFATFFDEAMASGGALVVSDTRNGKTIGSSRYDAYHPANGGSVEIGWTFLSRDCWGRGHNAEMKRLMIGHALQSVARVDFRVGETNRRSRRAMEKIGGKLAEGRVQKSVSGGREIVHVYYEIDRAAFAAGPLSQPA